MHTGRPARVGRLPTIEILFLCTGNICRSPAAEAILRHRLEKAGVTATVRSAGMLEGGQRASMHGLDVLSERGIDASTHLSQRYTRELLGNADLIVAMAREHVVDAAGTVREVWPRTFTLKELVRRGRQVGPRRAGQSLQDWLAAVHAGRAPKDLMGPSSSDDIADPIGQPRRAYERMVADLEELIDEMVWLVWGNTGRDTSREWAS